MENFRRGNFTTRIISFFRFIFLWAHSYIEHALWHGYWSRRKASIGCFAGNFMFVYWQSLHLTPISLDIDFGWTKGARGHQADIRCSRTVSSCKFLEACSTAQFECDCKCLSVLNFQANSSFKFKGGVDSALQYLRLRTTICIRITPVDNSAGVFILLPWCTRTSCFRKLAGWGHHWKYFNKKRN